MNHFTAEDLESLLTALEYTRGTISPGCTLNASEEPEWILIHKSKAESANLFLEEAIALIKEKQQH